MIFPLVEDFADALAALPAGHPRRRLLALLAEAVRRDVQFIGRHPTTLFQCLWNTGWWYDGPEAASRYDAPTGGWPPTGPAWAAPGPKVSALLVAWRDRKEAVTPGFRWARSLRPPADPLAGPQRAVYPTPDDGLMGLAYDHAGDRLAGATGQRLVVWDTRTGARLLDLGLPSWRVAFAPDGRRLAVGLHDHTLLLVDAATGHTVGDLRGHTARLTGVAFSPDGTRLASGSDDGTVRVWRVAGGRAVGVLGGPAGAGRWGVSAVAFFPDGRRLAAAQHDTVRVWDVGSGTERAGLRGDGDFLTCLAVAPDGRVAAGSQDRTVSVWDADSGARLAHLRGHQGRVTAVALAPDGRHLVSGCSAGMVYLWEVDGGREVARLRAQQNRLDGEVYAVAFHPAGGLAASGGFDGAARVWDVAAAAHAPRRLGAEQLYPHVAFSPDGRRLAEVSDDHSVWVWDAETGAPVARLCGHAGPVRGVALSADGRLLATGSDDRTARVWDPDRGIELARLGGLPARVTRLRFAPDGRRVAGADGPDARVWDVASGAEVIRAAGDGTEVSSLTFSPDGLLLAGGTAAGAVLLWDSRTGACLRTVARFRDPVRRLAFSRDGRRLASQGSGRYSVMDVGTGEQVYSGYEPDGPDYGGDFANYDAHFDFYAPWRVAPRRDGTTAVCPGGTFTPAAWLPGELHNVLLAASGRTLANGEVLYRLEGTPREPVTGRDRTAPA